MAAPTMQTHTGAATSRRARAEDVDRYVGARVRQRRVMLGLTQQQMADLIGVTYQQAHKYEKGINRVAAGRLYQIARVLGVDIGYFFEGSWQGGSTHRPAGMLLDLARNFISIRTRRHQEAVCTMARALNDRGRTPTTGAISPGAAGVTTVARHSRQIAWSATGASADRDAGRRAVGPCRAFGAIAVELGTDRA